jgi:hypothetical protein
MNKSLLLRLIKVMFGLLLIAFAYILIVGIGGSKLSNPRNSDKPFASVGEGQSRLLRLRGERAWLTRLSDTQRAQLSLLGEELSRPDAACKITAKLCAVFSETSQSGINLSFSAAAPPQLPSRFAWYGGFVDPTTGATFDLLGRAYKLGLETDQQQPRVAEF